MQVYSPTSTQTFARCPMAWHLYRAGWTEKLISKKHTSGAVGSGFASGIEHHHNHCTPEHEANCDEVARDAANEVIRRLTDHGAVITPEAHEDCALAPERAARAVQYSRTLKMPTGWEVKGVELELPQHGNARADLIVDTNEGPAVIDYKTKVSCSPYMRDKFIREMEQSWQLYHYVWALRDVGWDIRQFGVVLIILEPRPKTIIKTWDVDEDHLQNWIKSAVYWWRRMEQQEAGVTGLQPAMAPNHVTPFGLCEYHEFCFTHKLDPREAKFDYVQIARG